MNYVLALLLIASSPQLDRFHTKALVKPLFEQGFRPVETGDYSGIPFIIVENPHGRELMLLVPKKGAVCVMGGAIFKA